MTTRILWFLGRFANQMRKGEGDAVGTPLSKRYFPTEPMKFYIGTPVDEKFERGRPEEFFIGTLVPGPGTPPQTGKKGSDEISGVAVTSVLERATSGGEISGVAGRVVLERPNPDENLGWERFVNRMCVDTGHLREC